MESDKEKKVIYFSLYYFKKQQHIYFKNLCIQKYILLYFFHFSHLYVTSVQWNLNQKGHYILTRRPVVVLLHIIVVIVQKCLSVLRL